MNSIIDRFKARVLEDENGCHIWQGPARDNGYGACSLLKQGQSAHRVAYSIFNGEIQSGMVVMHKCDNKLCCNPEHLSLGSQKDNMLDMKLKGRHLHGAASPRARITEQQAREIKFADQYRGIGSHLAKKFGLTEAAVSAIRKGKLWSHLTP